MSIEISKIDPNVLTQCAINQNEAVFYNAESNPFRIYGVCREGTHFRRIPDEVARSVSQGVYDLHTFTSGGRIRFVTDSDFVAIFAKDTYIANFSFMCRTGAGGLDLYVGAGRNPQYVGTFHPPVEPAKDFQGIIRFSSREKRCITINLPQYGFMKKLYIGLNRDAVLETAPDYTVEKPIVYYGSSITNGCAVSRPGNSYESLLSRWLDCNYRNLGFAGNAKGEDAMTDYIASLDMSAFVMDYDHNAPTVEHLRATHERMFRRIRTAQPELPILIMSRPKIHLLPHEEERLSIIRETYEHAIAQGDRNVYMLDGKALMAIAGEDGLVDNCHPNDLGFFSMARAVEPVLRQMLNL